MRSPPAVWASARRIRFRATPQREGEHDSHARRGLCTACTFLDMLGSAEFGLCAFATVTWFGHDTVEAASRALADVWRCLRGPRVRAPRPNVVY